MQIKSAEFLRGVTSEDELLGDGKPQIAFIGRSNVGKSSVINTLTNKKDLARTSSYAGRTKEINIFLINKELYLLDLPGYGFAHGSKEDQKALQSLIYWYFFISPYQQKKVALIIDAEVGATKTDMEMLFSLQEAGKDVVIVANKIDKIKKSVYKNRMAKLQESLGKTKVVPFSAEKKQGVEELTKEIFL